MENREITVEDYIYVTRLIHYLGINASMKGHDYIRDIVFMLYCNPDKKYSLTRKVYPKIAKKYKISTLSVERNIRNAVERSFNICDIDVLEEIFSNTVNPEKGKATNTEFIFTLLDLFEIWKLKKIDNNW